MTLTNRSRSSWPLKHRDEEAREDCAASSRKFINYCLRNVGCWYVHVLCNHNGVNVKQEPKQTPPKRIEKDVVVVEERSLALMMMFRTVSTMIAEEKSSHQVVMAPDMLVAGLCPFPSLQQVQKDRVTETATNA